MKAETINKAFGQIKTIEDALGVDCASIGYVAKHKGQEAGRDLVALLIAQFVDSINVGQNLNKTQIFILAEDILEEFKHLKIADLVLFFKMVRRGKFGEFYNVLSPEKILIWLNDYFEQRCNFASSRSVRRASNHKQDNILAIEHVRSVKTKHGKTRRVIDKIVKRV